MTYLYKLTTAGNYTATTAVGPFGDTNTFTQTLGTLLVGAYQIYATVADSTANTATSMTNTFTVSLTTTISVQDADFETPGVPSVSLGWAHIADVRNPGHVSEYQQNSLNL